MEFNGKVLKNEIFDSFEVVFTYNREAINFFDPYEPIAFEELLSPFVIVAGRKLNIEYKLVQKNVLIILQRELLKELSRLSSNTLEAEFSIFTSRYQTGIERLFLEIKKSTSNTIYKEFIQYIQCGEFINFLNEYYVLADLMILALNSWIETVNEFFCRLKNDFFSITEKFSMGLPTGKVADMKLNLSDRHNNGRTVISVKFENGLNLIYKPKDITIECVCQKLFHWVNEKAGYNLFKTIRHINRKSYGWVEFIEHASCKDMEEVSIYYRRTGGLLAIMYLLEATDCHYENIIASGAYPVLIDYETLLQPESTNTGRKKENTDEAAAVNKILNSSVLRTAFLPHGRFITDGTAYDTSGLCAGVIAENPIKKIRWKNINTDIMKQEYGAASGSYKNIPYIGNAGIGPFNYIDEIVNGFKQLYGILLSERDFLLGKGSPLNFLKDVKLRFVFRSTRIYSSLFTNSLAPKYLRNEGTREEAFDELNNTLFIENKNENFYKIFVEEKSALNNLDIPLFLVKADKTALIVNDKVLIEEFFDMSGYDSVLNRINCLDKSDMELQAFIIRGSIYARLLDDYNIFESKSSVLKDIYNEDIGTGKIITNEHLKQIRGYINRNMVKSVNGYEVKIGIGYESEGDYYRINNIK